MFLALAQRALRGFDAKRCGHVREIWATGEISIESQVSLWSAGDLAQKVELFAERVSTLGSTPAVFFAPLESVIELRQTWSDSGEIELIAFDRNQKSLPSKPAVVGVAPAELPFLVDWLSGGRLLTPHRRALAGIAAALVLGATATALVVHTYRARPLCSLPPQKLEAKAHLEKTPHRAALVLVPPGPMCMGSEVTELGRDIDEAVHVVRLTGAFWIGSTEVTQDEWRHVMTSTAGGPPLTNGASPSRFRGFPDSDRHPVEQVSWYEALVYANRLSMIEGLPICYRFEQCQGDDDFGRGCLIEASGGFIRICDGDYRCRGVELIPDCRGYRLPTDAEWEYAARAGSRAALGGADIEIIGNLERSRNAPPVSRIGIYGGNSSFPDALQAQATLRPLGESCRWPEVEVAEGQECATAAVGTRAPNALGLYDVIGNVWEWVEDAYEKPSRMTFPPETIDPRGPEFRGTPNFVVHRGCSYRSFAKECRMASRDGLPPFHRNPGIGFRIARFE